MPDTDHREIEELSSLLVQPVMDAPHGIEQLSSLPFETRKPCKGCYFLLLVAPNWGPALLGLSKYINRSPLADNDPNQTKPQDANREGALLSAGGSVGRSSNDSCRYPSVAEPPSIHSNVAIVVIESTEALERPDVFVRPQGHHVVVKDRTAAANSSSLRPSPSYALT
ncbi:hypothetical protein CDL15_Pgr012525 [Punica granatum]|uniref:Uncharacterized protein n=1 Tax=Punica granatum TaxID=22663 RepID=A0A218XYL3_PUNGR|nr:hypothetical protein CDL15_Pgr012525 [Punica granatum]